MLNRRLAVWLALVTLAAVGFGGAAGCGVLNPAVLESLGINTVRGVDSPEGSLVIMVMNLTPYQTATRMTITKENGAEHEFLMTTDAYEAAPWDRNITVFDCDVQSIQVIDVTFTTETGTIEVPSNASIAEKGVNLYCGNVVAITLRGIGLTPDVVIY